MTPSPRNSESLVIACDIPVEGMSCAACVGRVERALAAVPGVTEATVNFVTHRATVRFDPSRANRERLAQAVEEAGYQVPAPIAQDIPGPTIVGAEPSESKPSALERNRRLEEAERLEATRLQRDFLLSLGLSAPLLMLAMAHGVVLPSHDRLRAWIQLVLATAVVLGPGRRLLQLAWTALRHRSTDMNTLVSLGVLSAYGYSLVSMFRPGLFPHSQHGTEPHLYFEAAGATITFVLLGRMLEGRARKRLSEAVRQLASLAPPLARRLDGDDREQEVPVEALHIGDLLLVRPGESIPIDAQVVTGTSAVNEAMLTGESVPVDKRAGALVYGGTLNQSGALKIRVRKTSADSALGRIVEAVEQAQGSRAPIARFADVVSAHFVPVVLAIAALTLLAWYAVDPTAIGLSAAIERFVAVLVIACPCALGLATPAAVAVGTGRGAELGILIKGGAALEAASRVDSVLLDKTGTLTAGQPELTNFANISELTDGELLSLIASAERQSEHPTARAVVAGALARGAELRAVEHFSSEPGYGIEAVVQGRRVRVGTAAWLARAAIETSGLEVAAEQWANEGQTPAFIAVGGKLAGLLGLRDRATDEARLAVAALERDGIDITILTGDRAATARAVASELGIERVIAEVRPEDKARIVAEERARGRIVAMVGDGINDAPALAGAHVGIAVSAATDVALAAADVTLVRGGISLLPTALGLARSTMRAIRQNLFWASIYNVITIPIAAGVLYPWTGWALSPVLASAAMSMSSVSVLLNSLRLRGFGNKGRD